MSRKVQHHLKELSLLKDKQGLAYQEPLLALGLLFLHIHSTGTILHCEPFFLF